MSNIVIHAEGLGKKYLLGHQAEIERYIALRDVIGRCVRRFVRSTADRLRGRPLVTAEVEEFWALKDISFEVKRGKVVGIIGRNGAGKSTLLKVISRITEPSAGRVTIRGRVASLLEVGTGFHPELTGRENIYLNGAILGMTRAEIRNKFDEIVAFAEVERFLDTPVKRYSSGMYVRLAFAVAAHLEPEILVVDEVLAVGDAEFQRKCLGKIGEVASGGRTVLFVSHNMAAIQTLCQSAILLAQGELLLHASVDDVIREYMRAHDSKAAFRKDLRVSAKPQILTASIAHLTCGGYDSGRNLLIDLQVHSPQEMKVEIASWIHDRMGAVIGFAPIGSLTAETPVCLRVGRTELSILIGVSRLAVGGYSLTLEITKPFAEIYDRCEDCLSFDIGSHMFEHVLNPLKQDWRVGSVLFPARLVIQGGEQPHQL
jgi:lipopolysaccharide transport system ATP-binding protein